MVFNEMYIFGVDQKSKMTATTVHLSCSGGHLGYLITKTKLYEDLGHVINIYMEYRKVDILKYTMFRPIQVPILTSFVLFRVMVSEKNIGN
jgi:hypothetical protein